jgi:predicted small lipoprotein YifL
MKPSSRILLKMLLAALPVLLMTLPLAACGTKGPLYLPKKEPVPAAKPAPPLPLPEPTAETTEKPGQ